MDDYNELEGLLGYSPEDEYTSVDDTKSNTEINSEPASPEPSAAESEQEKDDAIPYYTPSQYEPTPVEEQSPRTEDSAEEFAGEPRAEEPQQPVQQPYQQPVQPMYQQPYRQPVQPMYQQPVQQPYRQPVQQPYRQPVQQPYRQPVQPPYRQPVQQPYRQPVQQPYRQPVQQPYRQPVQPPYQQPVQPLYQQPVQPQKPQSVDLNYNPYAAPQSIPPQPNPYGAAPYQKPPKPPTSAGTKAFIAILAGLLVVMLIAFGIFIAMNSHNKKNTPDNIFPSEFSGIIDNDQDGYDPFGSGMIESTEFEEEIELIADNGETQQRDSDNPDSVGVPDPNAKQIELKPLPSDKDDPKYTTQSAFDTVSPGVVYVAVYQDETDEEHLVSQGTGTVISADGYIITNAHVIQNSRQYLVNVSLSSDKSYPAKIVGFDNWTDIAVLKVDAKDLTPVTFGDSELIEIGQDVIAIGNVGSNFKNSLTKGIVSAVDRELAINKNVKYIQSDATINPGNSGGPLCNSYGQVIGITSAKISSNIYESMSFSIPSKTVQEIASDLMRYGYVRNRVRMGFSGTEISTEDMYYYGVPAGILIAEIADDSPLKDTDIETNDIITAVDGIEISSFQDIYDILSDHKPGDKIKLKVYRQEE